jgi:hypothetical protein
MVSILVSKWQNEVEFEVMKAPPESDGTKTWMPWTPKAFESTSPRNAKRKTACDNSTRFNGTEPSLTPASSS